MWFIRGGYWWDTVLVLIWLSGSAVTGLDALNQRFLKKSDMVSGHFEGEDVLSDQENDDLFVNSADDSVCLDKWGSWPSANTQALESDNVLVFELFAAIGNLFLTFENMISIAHFLGVGVVLDGRENFPDFRQAFLPGQILWDIDPAPFQQRAADIEQGRANSSSLHVKTFSDGVILLSNDQFRLLTSTFGLDAGNMGELVAMLHDPPPRNMRGFISTLAAMLSHEAKVDMRVESCAWNMLLRMSPLLVDAMRTHSPWPRDETNTTTLEPTFRFKNYVAWHLRIPTEADIRQGYDPEVHSYMITETADVACPSFFDAMETARLRCPMLITNNTEVYISSISTSLGSSCIADLAAHDIEGVQVDMGLTADESHTSHHGASLDSTISAFLDFMFLMDAKAIVRTGSSFSGTVVTIRGLFCRSVTDNPLSQRRLSVCSPKELSC